MSQVSARVELSESNGIVDARLSVDVDALESGGSDSVVARPLPRIVRLEAAAMDETSSRELFPQTEALPALDGPVKLGVSPRQAESASPEPPMESRDPRLFVNRELSWLAFNDRVLAEARDKSLPIYERLKFLAIASSNLDEFFMVRVAGLKRQLINGVAEAAADGMTPADQLAAISERAHAMVAELYRIMREEVLPALTSHGVSLVTPDAFTADQKAVARAYFTKNVFPALTPLAVDPSHPFPHLRNKSLNIAVTVYRPEKKRKRLPKETLLAVVQVPGMLARLVRLPAGPGQNQVYVLLEDLIAAHVADLFPGYAVKGNETAAFRVIRNWDLNVDEEESEDLLSTIQQELRKRDRGAAVRLTIAGHASADLVRQLQAALKLEEIDVYRIGGPLQIIDLNALADVDTRPEMRVEAVQPVVPHALRDADSIVSVVAKGDVLLHHPYESFEPVVRFIEEAAEDPNVVAIKQTLYRTSGDSPFVKALSRAAENGKQVTALVEIMARFDEANNIAWARRLAENGVHVVYGVIGLKTHCKVAVVVRREGADLRRYVHVGTGNYNPTTARIYTDISLFSAREETADDVSALFNLLTGYSEPPQWKRIAVAPFGLQDKLIQLIDREAQKARAGEPARIIAKMNALTEPVVIRALYAASEAGVSIDLIVRGICCLRPGVPGISERIRVTSIVDRFLEHSRVFAFGHGEKAEVFIASADWMHRNLHRRIEVLFPVEDRALRLRLLDEVLGFALADTVKARRLQPDGRYVIQESNATPVRSQSALLDAARKAAEPPPDPLLRQIAAA
jgi:polyphosphate kinase